MTDSEVIQHYDVSAHTQASTVTKFVRHGILRLQRVIRRATSY